jgi:hypothetical protein
MPRTPCHHVTTFKSDLFFHGHEENYVEQDIPVHISVHIMMIENKTCKVFHVFSMV